MVPEAVVAPLHGLAALPALRRVRRLASCVVRLVDFTLGFAAKDLLFPADVGKIPLLRSSVASRSSARVDPLSNIPFSLFLARLVRQLVAV